jgi:hypothetical protein
MLCSSIGSHIEAKEITANETKQLDDHKRFSQELTLMKKDLLDIMQSIVDNCSKVESPLVKTFYTLKQLTEKEQIMRIEYLQAQVEVVDAEIEDENNQKQHEKLRQFREFCKLNYDYVSKKRANLEKKWDIAKKEVRGIEKDIYEVLSATYDALQLVHLIESEYIPIALLYSSEDKYNDAKKTFYDKKAFINKKIKEFSDKK